MKKRITLLVLVALLALSVGVSAQDYEFVGGVTYNSFNGDVTLSGVKVAELIDDFKSAIGFYGGVSYWVNDQMAVGGGLDYAAKSADGASLKLFGPYGNVTYKLNEQFNLNAGIAAYTLTTEDDYGKAEVSSMGFLLGGQYNQPIKEDMTFTADLGYRIAKFKDVTEVNMSGLRLSGGLVFEF